MRIKEIIVLTLALALSVACAKATVVYHLPGQDQPVVEITPKIVGRGCMTVDLDRQGVLQVVVAQDGSSDWSLGRSVAWIGELGAAVFSGRKTGDGMEGPDPLQGCAQLFTDEAEGNQPIVVAPHTHGGIE